MPGNEQTSEADFQLTWSGFDCNKSSLAAGATKQRDTSTVTFGGCSIGGFGTNSARKRERELIEDVTAAPLEDILRGQPKDPARLPAYVCGICANAGPFSQRTKPRRH